VQSKNSGDVPKAHSSVTASSGDDNMNATVSLLQARNSFKYLLVARRIQEYIINISIFNIIFLYRGRVAAPLLSVTASSNEDTMMCVSTDNMKAAVPQGIKLMKKKIFTIIVIFITALAFNPAFSQDAQNYFNKANEMLVSGNFEESVALYNQAIQKNPKFAEAYLGLGIAYKEQEKYQSAYDATLKAIKIRPSYYQAYYNLALICEKLNKDDEAIDAYEKFLKEVPGAERFSDARQRILKLKNKAAKPLS